MTEVDLENNNTNNNNSSSTKMEAANSERGMTQLSLRSLFGSTRRLAQQAPGLQQYRDNEIQTMSRSDIAGESRPVSLGFEEYWLSYQQTPPPPLPTHQKGDKTGRRKKRESEMSEARWARSQESFVLGINDPRNSSRMSPVSGLSGETYAVSLDDDDEDRVGEAIDETKTRPASRIVVDDREKGDESSEPQDQSPATRRTGPIESQVAIKRPDSTHAHEPKITQEPA